MRGLRLADRGPLMGWQTLWPMLSFFLMRDYSKDRRSNVMLPDHIEIPAAWFGGDLAKKSDIWHYTLQNAEVDELISAQINFASQEKSLGRLPLKTLS